MHSTADPGRHQRTRASYDALAEDYAARIYGELSGKPFDRDWLDDLALRTKSLGPVCDLGCGPAHIARYLQDRGVRALGLDLSLGNLRQARRLNLGLEFIQGDMLALPFASQSLGGIAAFYSIIHLAHNEVAAAMREMQRALRVGGWLLLAFHLGSEDLHEEELWGHRIELDVTLFSLAEVEAHVAQAGLRVKKAVERDPYAPEVEYQSRRGYILARRTS